MSKDLGLRLIAAHQGILGNYLAVGEASEVQLWLNGARPPGSRGPQLIGPLPTVVVSRANFILPWNLDYGSGIAELWVMWQGAVMLALKPHGAKRLHLFTGDEVNLKFNFKVVL